MRLPSREKIVANGGLKKYLSKSPDGNSQVPPGPRSVAPNMAGHYYAEIGAWLNAIAAQTSINTWQPTLASPYDFSLTQLWVIGGSGAGQQTVEAGVQVYGAHYGNNNANFFVYWTPDNYLTGCYNLDCGAFVQTSSVLPIGGAVPVSTFDRAQAGGPIAWYRDPATGNWILFLQNPDGTYSQSGYYPTALYGSGQLSQYATRVDFGGEVYTTASPPSVPMGSGYNPKTTYPLYGRVAFQKNLLWMDLSGTTQDYQSQWMTDEPQGNGCAYEGIVYPNYAPYQAG